MKSIARSIRITSKKLNLVAELVRLKNAVDALNILKFTPKKGAKILHKVVNSAVANAVNNFKQERPSLFIQEVIVTEGPTLKRSVSISRGRVNPILKLTDHVTVILGVKGEENNLKNVKETAAPVKETADKATVKELKKTPARKAATGKKKVTTVKA